jgi:hypothetical protein
LSYSLKPVVLNPVVLNYDLIRRGGEKPFALI